MRSEVSATLGAAQSASVRTPYIELIFNSYVITADDVDLSMDSSVYGNRILSIDHYEEAYNDFAFIVLRDYDYTIPDLRGWYVEVGYGDTTDSGNEATYSHPPRLYVMAQQTIYAGGKAMVVLELEGMWGLLRRIVAAIGDILDLDPGDIYGNTRPDVQRDVYVTKGKNSGWTYKTGTDFGAGATVYDILEYVIETMCYMYLDPLTVDDTIIDTLQPIVEIASSSGAFEDCQSLIYRLITMTYCNLRAKVSNHFEVVYPQSSDPVDINLYNVAQ